VDTLAWFSKRIFVSTRHGFVVLFNGFMNNHTTDKPLAWVWEGVGTSICSRVVSWLILELSRVLNFEMQSQLKQPSTASNTSNLSTLHTLTQASSTHTKMSKVLSAIGLLS